MKQIQSNKTIPKFRIVLSIPELKAISSALAKDTDNILDNAELIGWIAKQTRKAEFGVIESSHVSGPSVLSKKSEAIVQNLQDTLAKQSFDQYQFDPTGLSDETVLAALQYKAEHTIECGSLTEEESQVLNEAMTKKLLGGL